MDASISAAELRNSLLGSAPPLVIDVRRNERFLESLYLVKGSVRGADTSRLDLAPQSPGLLAISQGLSRLYEKDLEMLEHGMVMYDALYAWCRSRQ